MLRKAHKEIKNQNIATKAPRHQEKYNLIYFVPLCLCGFLLFAGCEKKTQKAQLQTEKQTKPALSAKPVEPSENTLKRENAELKAENEQLKKQLETLMGIDKPARIEAVSAVSSIELTNRCGIYGKNSDGKKERLVVYLRPIDDMGDVLKAAGAVKIELWNLNAKPNEALLKSWEIEPKDLRRKWSGSLLTSYYKLQFDVNSILTGKEKSQTLHSFSGGAELTLRVEFTDYLTGKILKAQRVVNSR
jgi:cell division protein FtsB